MNNRLPNGLPDQTSTWFKFRGLTAYPALNAPTTVITIRSFSYTPVVIKLRRASAAPFQTTIGRWRAIRSNSDARWRWRWPGVHEGF